jgi:hypothetical protein
LQLVSTIVFDIYSVVWESATCYGALLSTATIFTLLHDRQPNCTLAADGTAGSVRAGQESKLTQWGGLFSHLSQSIHVRNRAICFQ